MNNAADLLHGVVAREGVILPEDDFSALDDLRASAPGMTLLAWRLALALADAKSMSPHEVINATAIR